MDNNPLTYILTTPNLDALGHRWVAALASYNMTIKYLKGSDNKVANTLSQIETRLDSKTVTELLNHAKGDAPRAETEDIQIIEEDERVGQEVILCVTQLACQDKKFRNLCTEDWQQAQQMDPVIPHVLEWLGLPKNGRTGLKDFLRGKVSEVDCQAYGLREKDFKKRDHILFIKTTPPGSIRTIPVFVVPVNWRQIAIDACHWGAGHQGRDRSLSLMKEQFWWPSMANALSLVIQNCGCCKQFEAKCQIPEMEPILCTQPMELVHVDYVGMEITVAAQEKPVVKNVLVIVDHFTRYVQAFVTNNVELRPGDHVLVHLDAFRGQCRKLKNQWGDDIHTMISQMADGIPMYEVKNERTGKRKVLHRAWLLLWLADYGEPVRCNLMTTSDTLPGTVPGQQLQDSGEGLHPVLGDSLQYGLDLTHYMAIINNPEPMTSRIGCEVCMGVPRQAAGHRIPTDCDEEPDLDCLGSYVGDIPFS